jgi:hypothetical protein
MLIESRLVGLRVVHLGCRVVQYRTHLNRKRPLVFTSPPLEKQRLLIDRLAG